MNYLFHLHLSGSDPDIITGNFMGDFVKGRIGDGYPPRLRQGLELHRRIDSFAQDEPHFNRSRLRLNNEFGLYRGIMVDLYYDHFLAAGWNEWSAEPLEEYLRHVRWVVEANRPWLPERLQNLLPVIFEDMIPSYREPSGITYALTRMSKRLKRANPLAGGGMELLRHYDGLREDFLGFLPEARRFAARLLGSDR